MAEAEAEGAGELADAAEDIAETGADAAVEVARIEAGRDVELAQIAAATDQAAIDAAHDAALAELRTEVQECRTIISKLETQLTSLIPPEPNLVQLQDQGLSSSELNPPPAAESIDASDPSHQANLSPPPEPQKSKPRFRWI